MQLSEADWLNIERELCSRSLAEFAKRAWRVLEPAAQLKWGWVLDAICEHLEAVSNGDIKRLLVNVPPGSMKSLLTSVIFPAWEWGPRGKPELRYLSTAHKQDLAVRDNLKCRRLITSQWYQELWPVPLTGDQNAKTKFENTSTGFREAMAFTSMTGARGDRVILDDPHSVDDANSKAHLEAAVKTFREALPSRVNNEDSAIVIIMQRLHEKDVSAEALELGYDHLCIPMRYEVGRSKTTSIGWSDPRKEDGELMFPERFTLEQVVELEKSLGSYASAGQLQQRPSPAGGGIFKAGAIKHWSVLPDIEHLIIYGDTAMKIEEKNDFSVFELWAKGRNGSIYMIDMIRDKWEAPQLLVAAQAFWDKHRATYGGKLRKLMVEDKASGTGLIQQLRQTGIPVEGIQRNRDKVSRAHDTVPQIEVGRVYLPERHEHLSVLLDELKTFPAAAHDDCVDPLMDAVQDMLNSKQSYNWSGFL